MADDDNLVLRLLREIRDKQADDGRRLVRVERQLDAMKESMAMALGYAAHAVQVVDKQGDRYDEVQDQIEALRRRVADLEARRP